MRPIDIFNRTKPVGALPYFYSTLARLTLKERVALSAVQLVDNDVKDLIQDISDKDEIAIKWLSLVQSKQTQDISTSMEYFGQQMNSLSFSVFSYR